VEQVSQGVIQLRIAVCDTKLCLAITAAQFHENFSEVSIMNSKFWAITLLVATTAPAQEAPRAPKTYEINALALVQLKGQPNSPAVQAASAEADAAMHQGPFTVTSKSQTPPSGDRHDYMSMAPYFWPNPKTANHLPYVRRDGEHNPEIDSIPDHANVFKMENAVHALALGYALTGREDYAERATLLLRTWFLNPETRMNPHLNFAQAVLGVNTGRGIGIIETRGLPDVIGSIAMLRGSKNWTPADEAGMRAWFSKYYEWLTQSSPGRDEANAKNNHGSWYAVQAVDIALFLGKESEARSILAGVKERIGSQIEPDGKQPLELARTKSFSYSVFNLQALMQLADFGEQTGFDLWNYRAPNGGSIGAALGYLMPFAMKDEPWPYKAITGFDGDALKEPLLKAALHLHAPKYLAASNQLKGKDTTEMLILRDQLRFANAN
jgi:hypothetical protein